MVSWFKRPGDSKIPTTKAKLKARYELTCNRREDDRSRLKVGEEPVLDEEGAEEQAALDEAALDEAALDDAAAAANATVV
jgi:hypothetical protein